MVKEEDITLVRESELSFPETFSSSVFQNNRKGVGSSSERRKELDGAWWKVEGLGGGGHRPQGAPGVGGKVESHP